MTKVFLSYPLECPDCNFYSFYQEDYDKHIRVHLETARAEYQDKEEV